MQVQLQRHTQTSAFISAMRGLSKEGERRSKKKDKPKHHHVQKREGVVVVVANV
jgi:hypothetical protein